MVNELYKTVLSHAMNFFESVARNTARKVKMGILAVTLIFRVAI